MTGRATAVALQLRERIALGDLGPGGALESEGALGARYGVSRVTVRRALDELRAEGLVESRRGAGWFVPAGSFTQPLALGAFRHAGSAVESAGKSVTRHVVAFGFVPSPDFAAEALGIDRPDEVLSSVMVRTVDASPLDLVHEYVPAGLGGEVSRHDAEATGIWRSLERHGHRIDLVRQTVTATVATDEDAELLATSPGTALLLVRRIAISDTGQPLALSDHRYLAHRFSLEVEFRGWSGGSASEPPGLRAHDHPTTEETSS
jgi:GntR family transcriptional regulator